MSIKKRYQASDVQTLRQLLSELPAQPAQENLTARQVVEALKEDLLAKIKAGYTYDSLAEALSAKGLTISPTTLGDYLREATRKRVKKKTGAKSVKQVKGDSQPVTPSAPIKTTPPPVGPAASRPSHARFNEDY
jgi:hypothetical protein